MKDQSSDICEFEERIKALVEGKAEVCCNCNCLRVA